MSYFTSKNETLILFFEKKDLYVRIFVVSLLLANFFLNIIIASSLLLEKSCSADSSPFYYCVPSHNFFRNFFAKSFVVSIIIVTFAVSYPYWKLHWAKVGWTYIHKGVTVRFGFDAIRTSQLPNVCQEQSNGDVPWDVYIYSPCRLIAFRQ